MRVLDDEGKFRSIYSLSQISKWSQRVSVLSPAQGRSSASDWALVSETHPPFPSQCVNILPETGRKKYMKQRNALKAGISPISKAFPFSCVIFHCLLNNWSMLFWCGGFWEKRKKAAYWTKNEKKMKHQTAAEKPGKVKLNFLQRTLKSWLKKVKGNK